MTQEHQDTLVSLVPLEFKDQRARRGSPMCYRQTSPADIGGILGTQDSLVFRELRVHWVFKDLLVQEECQEDLDHRGPQDRKDHRATEVLASMAKKVNRAPQVLQVHLDFPQEN